MITKLMLLVLCGYSSVAFSMQQAAVKHLTSIQKASVVGMAGFGAGAAMSGFAANRASNMSEQCLDASDQNVVGFAAWATVFNGVGFACSAATLYLATKAKRLLEPLVAPEDYAELENSGGGDSGEFPGPLDQLA